MATVYLGLGSNLGNRLAHLYTAVWHLATTPGILLQEASSCYETAPVGYEEQGWFLNGVLRIHTSLSPRALLERVKEIEQQMKRTPSLRWGPRVIDIDLLLYDTLVVQEPDLQIPHPELSNRAFVLIPLYELAPHLMLPGGEELSLLCHHLPAQEVYYYAPFPLPGQRTVPGLLTL